MATKEAYEKKLEAQLKEWDAKVDVLTAKAHRAAADARIGYENELESLKSKRAEASKTLAELRMRSEHAWQNMKEGAENVWEEMNKALERLSARFK